MPKEQRSRRRPTRTRTETKGNRRTKNAPPPAAEAEEPDVVVDDAEVEAIKTASDKLLFSASDEIDNSLSLYLAELRKYPILTPEEEQEWARRAIAGDKEAQDRLVRHNLRFVVTVAKQYAGRGVPIEELIAEGNQGLLKAVTRFNPDRGTKFISYAVHWIAQSIRTALANQQRAFRIPPNRAAQLTHIHRAMQRIAEQRGRVATAAEIATETDIPAHMVETLLQVRQAELSLDSADAPDGAAGKGVPLSERIAAEESTEEQLERRFMVRDMTKALDRLRPRDQKILRLHYGLDGGREHTLEEIGSLLNITRERVRQLRDRALKELRQQHLAEELREYHS